MYVKKIPDYTKCATITILQKPSASINHLALCYATARPCIQSTLKKYTVNVIELKVQVSGYAQKTTLITGIKCTIIVI